MYKDEHPFTARTAQADRIKDKYPDRIPVIVERSDKSSSVPDIADIGNRKYLVPGDLSVGQFVYVLRKRINLGPERAMFIFVGNKLPSPTTSMASLYDDMKDPDGFLYVKYSGENTFGCLSVPRVYLELNVGCSSVP
jgi:GABA(A) receptor-associated protein